MINRKIKVLIIMARMMIIVRFLITKSTMIVTMEELVRNWHDLIKKLVG